MSESGILSPEHVAQLRLRAEQAGLAPEEFLRRRVSELEATLTQLQQTNQPT